MFTGIVEEVGRVASITQGSNAIGLRVRARRCAQSTKVGDSIAVNGCCLTVEKITRDRLGKLLCFSVLAESWRLTNLQFVQPGQGVNLERAARLGTRLGGHLVSGHIDGLGKIARLEKSGKDFSLHITAPAAILRYIILKGSIAVDGISLTVSGVSRKHFEAWIIPHTLSATVLGERKAGNAVNLEADLMAKYAERFATLPGAAAP